jgi:DNA primase
MSSPRHQRWSIADILDRTDLAALLDEHTQVTGAGHRRRWHCPVDDHHDQHPSVTMHTDAQGHERWRCWSGDDTHRGDAIDLVMITRRIDHSAALELLAHRAGLHLDDPLPALRHPPTAPKAQPVALHATVIQYVRACEDVLRSRTGRPVRDWLHRRGFSDELLHRNHVGVDPGRQMLRRPAGLPTGRSPAATFPALDLEGNVTYVQTRYLQPGPSGPKYENPASRLGSSPRLAWTAGVSTAALPLAPPPQRADFRLLVCEGIPDALTAAQHGFRAVAVLGAQAPDDRVADVLGHLAGSCGIELVSVVDGDDAGRRWGQRLTDLLATRHVPLRVVEPPDGLDLNEWALSDSSWAQSILSIGLPELRISPATVPPPDVPAL